MAYPHPGQDLWSAAGDFTAQDGLIASEDDCLALINALFPRRGEHFPHGRGDDCAELVMPGRVVLSTDYFLEHSHFRTAYFTPEEAGAKALAVAVSDLAGSGAVPLGFSLGLMLPYKAPRRTVFALLSGMAARAEKCRIPLTGGDISTADRFGFCITVWGQSAAPGADLFLRRGEALPGDYIFLIGGCGLARVGLAALEAQGRSAMERWPVACAAHLNPCPLLAEGRALAELAHAQNARGHMPRIGLMDLSDGPARDLPRLLAHRDEGTVQKIVAPPARTTKALGADLFFDASCIPAEVAAYATEHGLDAEKLFLLGGEDYALLGSCPRDLWPLVQKAVPHAVLLGSVTEEPGLVRHGCALRLTGFDHFGRKDGENTAAPSLKCASRPPEPQTMPDEVSALARQTVPLPEFSTACRELADLCHRAWVGGLLPGVSGNASLRIDASRPSCAVTRSGAAKGALTPEDFALLALDNGALLAGARASSEAAAHLAIYNACPETTAVLHTHPPHLLALSLALPPEKRLRLPLFEAARFYPLLGLVPDLPPGTADLALAVAKLAETHPALWLERHGLITHGKTLQETLVLAEELEQLAKVQLLALSTNV